MGDYIGGVAYGAKLYALKVIDSAGYIYDDDVVAAWDWCVSHRDDDPCNPILVISTSLGGGRYFSPCDGSEYALATAVNNAVASGITMVSSTGNEGFCDSITAPGCLSNVISVGAVYDDAVGTYTFCVDEDSCAPMSGSASCDSGEFSAQQVTAADVVAVYSNSADFMDFFAPSHDAYTTDISGSAGYTSWDYMTDFGGTSASSPYVAGVVACLQSAFKDKTGSYLSPSEIRSILALTGDDVTDSKVAVTKPRINMGKAVDSTIIQAEYSSTDVPLAIPNPGTVNSTLDVFDNGAIIDVNVSLDITHTRDSDLDVYLISPDSTRVELFTDVGSSGDNFSNTILDDEASVSITSGTAPFSGSYRPEGSLSEFDTENIAGTWTLEVSDDFGTLSGTLNSWSIIFTIMIDGEPNAPVLHSEPDITPGLCNTISWDPVPEAGAYYTEFSDDPCFSPVLSNSGWITDTEFEFCELVSGQEYWYRVKSAYSIGGGVESAWSNVESSRQCGTPGDFEPDCDVDWDDLAVFMGQWLQAPGTPSADIAPPPAGDGIVDFYDYSLFAAGWLEGVD